MCGYHSSNIGHYTKYCINLKNKIHDQKNQELVSLQTVVPNVNTNPLSNHGGVNMIDKDYYECVANVTTPIVYDYIEKVVAR